MLHQIYLVAILVQKGDVVVLLTGALQLILSLFTSIEIAIL